MRTSPLPTRSPTTPLPATKTHRQPPGLTQLQQLDVSHALISAAGLAPLAAALTSLESLQLTGCSTLHSPCRAQLPEEMTRLTRLATLYLDFTLHVRDVQVRARMAPHAWARSSAWGLGTAFCMQHHPMRCATAVEDA